MVWNIMLVIGGLVFLFFGGESLVRGSVAIAERFGISKLVVGMVIVGFGTSAPELLVSVQAALAGSPDIAVGNIVGSNIANILLIVGIAALIAPLANADKGVRREAMVMLAASIAVAGILLTGNVSRNAGIAMLSVFAGYLGATYVLERRRQASAFTREAEEAEDIRLSAAIGMTAAIIGLALLVVGARILVDGATGIARIFDVSEAVIGLTIVAVGTSLPELATAIVATLRRHPDVVLANVIGSNVFNILFILGVTAAIAPIPVAGRFGLVDGPVMAGVALLAAVLLSAVGKIGRVAGLLLLAAYASYVIVLGMPG